jgi:hypothetical protein
MAVDWLNEEDKEVFKYVKSHADEYAKKIYYSGWSAYSAPHADVRLHKLETVVFDPADVTLGEHNWLNEAFGSADDYLEFEQRRDKNVKFCVYQADEYLDAGHPAFKGVDITIIDFTGKETHPTDKHGTAVCSQYGSSEPRYSPFPNITKSPKFKIIAGTVLHGGTGDFQNIINFINFVAKDAVKQQKDGYVTILNMSLGADADTPPPLQDAITKAKNAGVYILVANGNSGLPRRGTPANAEGSNGVMALTPEMRKANFSNYDIGTVYAEGGVMNTVAVRGGDWGHMNGTSFSSPYTVNTVMAFISLAPQRYGLATEYHQDIVDTLQDLGVPGRDNIFGEGKSRLRKILDATKKEERTTINIPEKRPKPLTKSFTLKSIVGWEISWKHEGAAPSDAINTIFLEELDVEYRGTLSADKVEENILPKIAELLNNTTFITASREYDEISKYVLAYIGKTLKVKLTYAIVDNNEDGMVVVEISKAQLGYWGGKRSRIWGKVLKSSSGVVLIKTL